MNEIKLLDHEIGIRKTAAVLLDGPDAGLCSLSLSDDCFGAYRQKLE